MKLTFTLLALVGCFAGCHKQTQTKADLVECPAPGTVTVALNNCTEKANNENPPSLCFVQLVEDSRCPANAVCVWEGVAVARFSFKTGTSAHDVVLATKKLPNRPSTDTVVGGVQIRLLSVSPYPGTGPGPVEATVQIR